MTEEDYQVYDHKVHLIHELVRAAFNARNAGLERIIGGGIFMAIDHDDGLLFTCLVNTYCDLYGPAAHVFQYAWWNAALQAARKSGCQGLLEKLVDVAVVRRQGLKPLQRGDELMDLFRALYSFELQDGDSPALLSVYRRLKEKWGSLPADMTREVATRYPEKHARMLATWAVLS